MGGDFRVLGRSFTGPAWNAGTLNLFYWDSNNFDNTGSVLAAVTTAVPEPAAWTLMIGGFGLAGAMLRLRRATTTVA